MERVQFQQEQMLDELKDLVEKGLFTQEEVKQIMKKRTVFETSLVRRIPKKSDFLRYAAYEMNLEALRKKRVARLKIPRTPATISDYSLLRRQFQIFERALRKFKDDVGLWIQYIQTAEKAHARALISKICGRALQMHPNNPSLYVIAASHELKQQSYSAARVLLQRGIRMNSENIELWTEYIKLELGFAELLRRRWAVLGLGIEEKRKNDQSEDDSNAEGEMDLEVPLPEDEADESARREILNGALVRESIDNAVKASPSAELFSAIQSLLTTFPSPKDLRHILLNHLHSCLQATLHTKGKVSSPGERRSRAKCARIHATRHLDPEAEGEAMVDAIRQCNEEFASFVRSENSEEICSEYAEFVKGWFERALDDNMNIYFLVILQTLCKAVVSSSLFNTHINLLRSPANPQTVLQTKLLKTIRKYVSRCPDDESLWISRLQIEASSAAEVADANWEKARQEAIDRLRRTKGEVPDSIRLWVPSA